MSPSDMTLQIGTTADYNNKIVIAKDSLSLGLNNDANVKPVLMKPVVSVQGTKNSSDPTATILHSKI